MVQDMWQVASNSNTVVKLLSEAVCCIADTLICCALGCVHHAKMLLMLPAALKLK